MSSTSLQEILKAVRSSSGSSLQIVNDTDRDKRVLIGRVTMVEIANYQAVDSRPFGHAQRQGFQFPASREERERHGAEIKQLVPARPSSGRASRSVRQHPADTPADVSRCPRRDGRHDARQR